MGIYNKELIEEARSTYKDYLSQTHIDRKPCLVVFGESYAYGTNVETSDIDIRGIVPRTTKEILTGYDHQVYEDGDTDTTFYTVDKFIDLASACNPNIIEMLGCEPDAYIYTSPIGEMLIDKKKIFLSQRCVDTFGGYAISQLRRLENLTVREVEQSRKEEHILESIENASSKFLELYAQFPEDSLKLYIDKAVNEDLDTEIFMDVNLKHYPLRDYANLWNELKSIVSSYNRLGKRNTRAKEHGKIGKHSMHLVRLYMMCIDILEKEEIITYRRDEHDLLMDIRNGKYLTENNQVRPEFFEIVDSYQKKLEEAKKNTSLPPKVDKNTIETLKMIINRGIINGVLG